MYFGNSSKCIFIPGSVVQNLLHRAHFFILPCLSTSVAHRGPFPFSRDGAQPVCCMPFCLKGNLQSWTLPLPL